MTDFQVLKWCNCILAYVKINAKTWITRDYIGAFQRQFVISKPSIHTDRTLKARDWAGEELESPSSIINHYCSAPSRTMWGISIQTVVLACQLVCECQREICMNLKGIHYITYIYSIVRWALLSLIFPNIFFSTTSYSGQYYIKPNEDYNSPNQNLASERKLRDHLI